MDTAYMLARIFGIMLIVLYGGFLINHQFYRQVWQNILEHPLLLLLSGFIALLCGLLVIQIHQVWTLDWKGLITLLAWTLILNGGSRILFPQTVLKMTKKIMENYFTVVNGTAIVMLLIGFYLTYIGFSQ